MTTTDPAGSDTRTVTVTDGIHELTADISGSPYYNADMAPTTRAQRKWNTRDIAALWVGMSACIPSYMLASGLISQGMSWWQGLLTVTLGNVIVLLPMVLNAHAGTKYGIPFPVYCRASFGIVGANIPAILRALVACGWFGIQAWIGGKSFYLALMVFWPAAAELPRNILGINAAELACFLVFWALNVGIIVKGIEAIRILMNIATPILIAIPLGLLGWALWRAGGWGPIFNQAGTLKGDQFWKVFFPSLTGMVGFWSTLALNIPDFSRFAKSQRAQVVGQALGLPTTMGFYAFIGVAVTSATVVIFGNAVWDPNELLGKFESPVVILIAVLSLTAATLSTNIAANVVSPANDFSHLAPKLISARTGGLITAVIGVIMVPWKLVEDPTGYIFNWLIAYSSLLGAIGGVLIADYFVIRRTVLDLPGLYREAGPYWYKSGFNPAAIAAMLAGVGLCVPGFLGRVAGQDVGAFWMQMYDYAWFISFAVAFGVYVISMKMFQPPRRLQ